MQLCFLSVHGPRETYFVDEPRITEIIMQKEFRAQHTQLCQEAHAFVILSCKLTFTVQYIHILVASMVRKVEALV
jgi:hypothetical protein